MQSNDNDSNNYYYNWGSDASSTTPRFWVKNVLRVNVTKVGEDLHAHNMGTTPQIRLDGSENCANVYGSYDTDVLAVSNVR